MVLSGTEYWDGVRRVMKSLGSCGHVGNHKANRSSWTQQTLHGDWFYISNPSSLHTEIRCNWHTLGTVVHIRADEVGLKMAAGLFFFFSFL